MINRPSSRVQVWRPWMGWIGGAAGWFATQQLGGELARGACSETGPLVHALIALAGLALAGLGAFLSYPAWRRRSTSLDEAAPQPRAFIAVCGMGAAFVFALAIVFQTLSVFIIPRCYG
jgi:hypothetical protein